MEAVIYFCGILMSHVLHLPFQMANALQHIPFFLMGMYFRKERKEISVPWYLLALLHGAMFVLWHEVFAGSLLHEKVIRGALRPLLHCLGILMVFSLMESMARWSFWDTRLYRFFAAHSFAMYLFHQQIVYCSIVFCYGRFSPFVSVAVNYISALAVSALISVLIERCRHRWQSCCRRKN